MKKILIALVLCLLVFTLTGMPALASGPPPPPPVITTSSPLPNGEVGAPYSQTLAASAGTPSYIWSIISGGQLPSNLQLDPATGAITGTPTAQSGPTAITFEVTDSLGVTATKALSITIAPPPSITTGSLLDGTVGSNYSQNLTVSGGTSPYTWHSPAQPPWLNLTPAGLLWGGPVSSGDFTVTVDVTDSLNVTASQTFILHVADPASTVATATGAGPASFSTSDGVIQNLTAVDASTLPPPPQNTTFLFGLFSFKITGLTLGPVGEVVTVTITLPSNIPTGTEYLKYQGGWTQIQPPNFSYSGNVITLTLQDGGAAMPSKI